jgi:hypothetical protein
MITTHKDDRERECNVHKLKVNLSTHIYAKDFVDTVHVRKATDNFPYDSVEARTETTTSDNTRNDII